MLWFWLSGYFLGFLTIAGMAYVIGGHRPRPFIGAALWLVAILWLLIAPSAYRYSVENVEREYVGILTPHACWCARLLNVPAGYSVGYGVEIGTSVGELWELKTGPIEMFSKPMALDLDRDNNGQLIISAQIVDRFTHRLAVTIDKGKWHTSDAGDSWDFNYSDDALEVLGSDKRVVLQIRALSYKVQIQGESWNESGTRGIRLVQAPDPYVRRTDGLMMILTPTYDPDEPHIEPMFKYPRQFYLGQIVVPEIDPLPSPNAPVAESDPMMCAFGLIFGLLVLSSPIMLFFVWLRRRFFAA